MFASTVVATPCNNNVAMCKAGSRSRPCRRSFFGGDSKGWGWSRWRCLATADRTTATHKAASPPWLMLSSPTKPDYRYFFDITRDRKLQLNREIHLPQISDDLLIGSSQGLLVSLPPCCFPNVTALDPLTGSHLPLPPTSTLIKPTPTVGYVTIAGTEQPKDPISNFNFPELAESKVLVSPSRDVLIIFCPYHAFFTGIGGRCSPVASSSSSSSSWHFIPFILNWNSPWIAPQPFIDFVDDCIFHKGHLHVTDNSGRLAVLDFEDPLSPPFFVYMDDPVGQLTHQYRKYLVESPNGDDLFLLYRAADDDDVSRRTTYFRVFRLDKDCAKWNLVESIGDAAMFVGRNTSMSVSTSDFPNLKSNSIYFTDDLVCHRVYLGGTGVFSLEDKEIHFFDFTDGGLEKLDYSSPMWFSPTGTAS